MKKNICFKIPIYLLILVVVYIGTGCGFSISQEYSYDDSMYSTGNKAFTQQINSIEIDWIVGNVYIYKSDNHELIIREETDINSEEQYRMHYLLDDGELDIKFCGSFKKLEYDYKTKNLYVYLPSQLMELDINTTSADVELLNVVIEDLDLDNVSGDISINNSTISNLDIDNVSGQIILMANNIKNLDVDSVSGDIGVSYNNIPMQLEIETTSANVTIYATEGDFRSINFETISGTFKSNLTYNQTGNKYVFSGSNYDYDVETISGYLKVLKK